MAGDMEDLQWLQDRVKRLERQLAEAQLALTDLAAEKARAALYGKERDALKAELLEAQAQITYERERNRNNVGMADEEIGRLKATVEQARRTLADIASGELGISSSIRHATRTLATLAAGKD